MEIVPPDQKDNRINEKRAGDKHSLKIRRWQITSAILGVLLIVLLTFILAGNVAGKNSAGLTGDAVADKTMKYINENMLNGRGSAKVDRIERFGDLYLLKLDVQGQKFDSYVTKDGAMLFTQAINLNEKPTAASPATEQEPARLIRKTGKPKVELFVMSHCPYGTQMEKGIIPAVKALGSKIDFEVKFVNYAMHPSQGEVEEQLNQYCIQMDYREKYLAYLSKFLEAGNTEDAFSAAGLRKADISKCVQETDTEFSIRKNLEDRSSWASGRFPKFMIHDADNRKYGVQGSPTLIVNGEQVESGRDAKSILNTICEAFAGRPSECNTDMTSFGTPAPGFGFGAQGGSAAEAGCSG